ncbi:hypothetical protein K438DRAFT_2007068 [Mycena galopus ATCC 62051]|nr:hypothetical protein K438DRAFT_2007068 [Mycena galopus ATCC 62051]
MSPGPVGSFGPCSPIRPRNPRPPPKPVVHRPVYSMRPEVVCEQSPAPAFRSPNPLCPSPFGRYPYPFSCFYACLVSALNPVEEEYGSSTTSPSRIPHLTYASLKSLSPPSSSSSEDISSNLSTPYPSPSLVVEVHLDSRFSLSKPLEKGVQRLWIVVCKNKMTSGVEAEAVSPASFAVGGGGSSLGMGFQGVKCVCCIAPTHIYSFPSTSEDDSLVPQYWSLLPPTQLHPEHDPDAKKQCRDGCSSLIGKAKTLGNWPSPPPTPKKSDCRRPDTCRFVLHDVNKQLHGYQDPAAIQDDVPTEDDPFGTGRPCNRHPASRRGRTLIMGS